MYIVGVVVILGLLTFMISRIYGLYRTMTISPRADRAGITLVDFMTKEIRTGESVNLGESVLGVANGALTIQAIEEGESIAKEFALVDGRITYQEEGGVVEYLSPENIEIAGLVFHYLPTDISEAIRYTIDITFEGNTGPKTRSYSGLSILRYSYD